MKDIKVGDRFIYNVDFLDKSVVIKTKIRVKVVRKVADDIFKAIIDEPDPIYKFEWTVINKHTINSFEKLD